MQADGNPSFDFCIRIRVDSLDVCFFLQERKLKNIFALTFFYSKALFDSCSIHTQLFVSTYFDYSQIQHMPRCLPTAYFRGNVLSLDLNAKAGLNEKEVHM